MSGETFIDLSNPDSELTVVSRLEFSEDGDNNNVNSALKALLEGDGEDPDLITEEAPPEDVLKLTSDPDFVSDNHNNDFVEGERTDVDTTPEPIPAENELQSRDPPHRVESKVMNPKPNNLSYPGSLSDLQEDSEALSEITCELVTDEEEEDDDTELPPIPLKLSNPYFSTINTLSAEIDRNDIGDSAVPLNQVKPPVDAPEAEGKFDASQNNSPFHIPENIKELPETSKAAPESNNDSPGGSDEQLRNKSDPSQSSSIVGLPHPKDLSSSTSWKSGTDSKRRRSSGKTHGSSKSPNRYVEVHKRSKPIKFKSKDGKPPSPYLCRIFPIPDNPGNQTKSLVPTSQLSEKFMVSEKQNRLLDVELNRAVEKEHAEILDIVCSYVNRKRLLSAEAENVVADGSSKETYMSWILKDRNSEEEEKLKNDDRYWNPVMNSLRRNTFTQVSSRPSFSDKEQLTSLSLNNLLLETSQLPDRIRLVGKGSQEEGLRISAYRMYENLKTLQKAIHLSDCFCFRNAPELPLGTAFTQPGFQEFFESANEIEILQNVVGLLTKCKESIQEYLNSVHNSNPIVEEGSCLTKMAIPCKTNEKGEYADDASKKEPSMEVFHFTPTSPSNSSQTGELTAPFYRVSRNRILPQVHAFVEEQVKVTLSSYYNDPRTLIQTVMCDGHRYQIHFSSSDPSGPIQGIVKAKMEYIGQPSHISLPTILNTIHRCANYIDTRIACSCVWARQSKKYFLDYIEYYLDKRYRPSTECNWWKLRRMRKRLQKINVFSGIIRQLSDELVDAVGKLQFCMQKALDLLDTLKEPEIPGFASDLRGYDEVNLNSGAVSESEVKEALNASSSWEIGSNKKSSLEKLYEKLDSVAGGEGKVSVEALMKILATAVKNIESVSRLGEQYFSKVKVPRKCKRVMKFMNSTSSQLGFSKDVQLGSLVASFLSAIDKIGLFEEFMCEQRVEIRAKVHKLCMKIVRSLYDLRCCLCVQQEWSYNLSKNSFMRVKEINEIRRLRKLKKGDKFINEKMEFLRGSDRSLREALW